MESDDAFMRALQSHDDAVDKLELPIWTGAEPTYTDRWSEAPEWLSCALGDDKQQRAQHVLKRLATSLPGAVIFRSVGRQYDGESVPRWSYGLYRRRDGAPLWHGPPDPILLESEATSTAGIANRLADKLAESLNAAGFQAARLDPPYDERVIFRIDGQQPPLDPSDEPLLSRPSIHQEHVEGAEIVDELAARGNYLVVCSDADQLLCIELPKLPETKLLQQLLDALARVSNELQVPAMILAGFPPPVNDTVAWMTVTADPAVLEINMAPECRTSDIMHRLKELEQATEQEGLNPFRLQYNGEESDSGGGGQITLGGPSPTASPFLANPGLLSSLIRYFNRHPSLSYLHAFESIGPGSQAPRVDESARDAMAELRLALELLERNDNPSPEVLWATLSPFLADSAGNTHRAEINIEKLWNPFLGNRGRQGLVEFRSFRMGPAAETTASLVALLRAVVAMLVKTPCREPLVDWGDTLHDRFSLPLFLHADLKAVLSDLDQSGLGLGDAITKHLFRDQDLILTECELGESRLQLRRALEFWPLIGDAAMQEGQGSRLIDASTYRIEVRLRCNRRADLKQWRLSAFDWAIPIQESEDEIGPLGVIGLRYRNFVPLRGLHPTLPSQTPVSLNLSHPRDGAWRMTVHHWDPSGNAYPGLPKTIADARVRRAQRCVLEPLTDSPAPGIEPRKEALGEYVVDLRWR